jgi:hypothetical protein
LWDGFTDEVYKNNPDIIWSEEDMPEECLVFLQQSLTSEPEWVLTLQCMFMSTRKFSAPPLNQ